MREFIAQYVNHPPSPPQIPTERLSTLSKDTLYTDPYIHLKVQSKLQEDVS